MNASVPSTWSRGADSLTSPAQARAERQRSALPGHTGRIQGFDQLSPRAVASPRSIVAGRRDRLGPVLPPSVNEHPHDLSVEPKLDVRSITPDTLSCPVGVPSIAYCQQGAPFNFYGYLAGAADLAARQSDREGGSTSRLVPFVDGAARLIGLMVAQGKTLQEVERVLRGEGDESDERAARGVRRQESCRVALADATAEMFGFDDVYGGAWGSLAALSADSQLRTALLNDTSALLGATADRRYLTDLPVGEAASPSDQPPTMSIPFSGIVRHMLPDWIRPTTPDELNKAAAYPLANAALVAQILAEGGAVVYPGNSRKISPFGDSGILKMDSHSWVRAGLVCAMEDGVIKGDSERAAQHFQVVDRLAGHAFRQDGGVERVDPYYQLRGHLNTVPGYNAGGWTVDHMTDPQTRGLRTNGPVEVMIDAMGTVRRFLRANSNVKNVRKEVCKGLKISAAERDGLFDWACDNGADPLPPNFYPPQLGGLVNTVGGLVHERAVERRAAAGRALPFFPVLKGLVKPAAEGDPVL